MSDHRYEWFCNVHVHCSCLMLESFCGTAKSLRYASLRGARPATTEERRASQSASKQIDVALPNPLDYFQVHFMTFLAVAVSDIRRKSWDYFVTFRVIWRSFSELFGVLRAATVTRSTQIRNQNDATRRAETVTYGMVRGILLGAKRRRSCHVARPRSATRQIILKNYATYRSKLHSICPL